MAINIFEKNRTVRPSGPSLQEKYDAGKKAYAASLRKNRGQAGGISSISPQAKKATMDNLNRQKFFKGRDVPEERLRRRIKQDSLERQFKDTFTRPAGGSKTNLLQMTEDAPRSLAAERERLANILGPTPSEIFGDIGFGLGNIFQGFAEKGTPMFQVLKGLGSKIKTGVEAAWDAVRGEPTTVQGTAFPQPSSDTKDFFSSIDTGVAEVDPNNMLVQIAKANEGRFDDKPTFQEQLANATAMNLNIPSPTDVAQTITDYYNAAAQGVDVNTPIGKVNVNPLAEKIFLDGGIGDVKLGGFIDPNTLDYNLGINTALPGDFKLSAGASSSDLPGVSLSNTYLPKIFGVDIPVISDVTPSLNMSGQGDLSLGVNTTIDPLKTIFPGSSVGTPINLGASVDSRGNVTPNINLMVPFNSGGLGYMFK
tara:strand:- start:750 stop:2018 length:1269 start_codon:yes stop_codon:yes gene_type:complete